MQIQSMPTSSMFPDGQATCHGDQRHGIHRAKLESSVGFPLKRAQSPTPHAYYYGRPLTPCALPVACFREAVSSLPHRPVGTTSWNGTRPGVGPKIAEPLRPLSVGIRYCTGSSSTEDGQGRFKKATISPPHRNYPVWGHGNPTHYRYVSPLQTQNGYTQREPNPSTVPRLAPVGEKLFNPTYNSFHGKTASPAGKLESREAANAMHRPLIRPASVQPHASFGRSRPLVPLFSGFQFSQSPPVGRTGIKPPLVPLEQLEEQRRPKRPASAPPSFVSRFWAFLNGSEQTSGPSTTRETPGNLQKSFPEKLVPVVNRVRPSQMAVLPFDMHRCPQNQQATISPCSKGEAICKGCKSPKSQTTSSSLRGQTPRRNRADAHAASPQSELFPAAGSSHPCDPIEVSSSRDTKANSLTKKTSYGVQQQSAVLVGNDVKMATTGLVFEPSPSAAVKKGLKGRINNEARGPVSPRETQQSLLRHYQDAILQHRQRLLDQQQTIQQYEERFKKQQAVLESNRKASVQEETGCLQKQTFSSEQGVLPCDSSEGKRMQVSANSGVLPATPIEGDHKAVCSSNVTAPEDRVSHSDVVVDYSDEPLLVGNIKPEVATLAAKRELSPGERLGSQEVPLEGSETGKVLTFAVQPSLPTKLDDHVEINKLTLEKKQLPQPGEVTFPQRDAASKTPQDPSANTVLPQTSMDRCGEAALEMLPHGACDTALQAEQDKRSFGGVHFGEDLHRAGKESFPLKHTQNLARPKNGKQDSTCVFPTDSFKEWQDQNERSHATHKLPVQNVEKREQVDVIPVAPLIEAVNTAQGWGALWGCPERSSTKMGSSSVVDIFLPIQSMVEFESLDGRQHGLEALKSKENIVGSGTYGVVRKLRHRLGGFVVAVKSIRKDAVVQAGMVGQVEFELWVQRDLLRHPNVLRCLACVEDANFLHIILDYCEKGDLYRRIREQPNRRFEEFDAFCFFAQLLNGLNCVHRSGVIHRDLKLENLLLARGNVLKIADFGWCESIVGKSRSFGFCGTLDYLAPEMIKGQGHDWRVDMWSLGVLLYEFLDGRPPFESTRHLELVQRIITVDISMPQHIASDAADLIRGLLQYDPNKRLSHKEVGEHPWVQRMWKELYSRALKLNPALKWNLPVWSEAPAHSNTRLVEQIPRCVVSEMKENVEICHMPIRITPNTDFGILTSNSRSRKSTHGRQNTEQESSRTKSSTSRRRIISPSKGTRQTDAFGNIAKRITAADRRSSKVGVLTDVGTTAEKRPVTPQADRISMKLRPGRGRSSNSSYVKAERDRLPAVDLNCDPFRGYERLNTTNAGAAKMRMTPDRKKQSATRGTAKVFEISVDKPIRPKATPVKESDSKTAPYEALDQRGSLLQAVKPPQNPCIEKQQVARGTSLKGNVVVHEELKEESDAMTCLRSVRKVKGPSRNLATKCSGDISGVSPCSQTPANGTAFQEVRSNFSQISGGSTTYERNPAAVKADSGVGKCSVIRRQSNNSHDPSLQQHYFHSFQQYQQMPRGSKSSGYHDHKQSQGCVFRQLTAGQGLPTSYAVCGDLGADVKKRGQPCRTDGMSQIHNTCVPLGEADNARSKLCSASQPPGFYLASSSTLKQPAPERRDIADTRLPLLVAGFPRVVEPKFLSNPAALFG